MIFEVLMCVAANAGGIMLIKREIREDKRIRTPANVRREHEMFGDE